MMNTLISLGFLATNVLGVVITSGPTDFRTLQDKVQYFKPAATGWSQYWPDGKMLAYRSDLANKTSPFIYSITPDYRLTSADSFFNNVTNSAGASYNTGHGNYIILPNDTAIPGPDVTGARGNGMHYDYNSIWLFNAFRLSETSNPSAGPNEMIGFVHNEDYWDYGGAVNGCTYKSIGVRYSHDLGKSWTRSVPILTKGYQVQNHSDCTTQNPAAGTGDMAAMWNPLLSRWVIFGQEGQINNSPPLVMSYSSDPLGKPGSWTRYDPKSGLTDPGFIGTPSRTLAHGDLASAHGANPSIIRDTQNNVWHMVYSKWGGGLVYSNSTDLTRWQTPVSLTWPSFNVTGAGYPTLIGDEGDTLTTTGTAWLWVKGKTQQNGLNTMYGIQLDFSH